MLVGNKGIYSLYNIFPYSLLNPSNIGYPVISCRHILKSLLTTRKKCLSDSRSRAKSWDWVLGLGFRVWGFGLRV